MSAYATQQPADLTPAQKARISLGLPAAFGRPTVYTDELGTLICDMIAFGMTLREIEAKPDLPCRFTIWKWCQDRPTFQSMYLAARERSAESLENEALYELREARTKDASLCARNLLEGIKWSAAKRNAEVYGEKVTTDVRFSGSLAIDDGNSDRTALMVELMRRLGVDAPVPPMIEGSVDSPDEDAGSV